MTQPIPETTYLAACLAGQAGPDDLAAWEARYHREAAAAQRPALLYRWLGLTWEEYRAVRDLPQRMEAVIRGRRQGIPLTQALAEQEQQARQHRATCRGLGAAVRSFHEAFGLPVAERPRADVGEGQRRLRWRLLEEELEELRVAQDAGDVVAIADALADAVYVLHGTAVVHGIDLDAVLAEVHRANMSKLDESGQPLHRADGKVLKGRGCRPPDVAGVPEVAPDEAPEARTA